MKEIKKILCCILAVAMLITIAVPSTAEAASYKSKLKSLQKKTEKQVGKYKKQWKSEKKKYKSQTKGTEAIYGTIESRNPFIVYSSLDRSYYWVENSKYMNSALTIASGHVKVTGKTKRWNNVTCAVVKAVKVTASPSKYEKLYKDASKKLKDIKNALKNTFTIYYWHSGTVVKNNDELTIYYVDWDKWYSADYDNRIETRYKYDTEYSYCICYYDSSILNVNAEGDGFDINPCDGIEAGTKTRIKILDKATGKKITINIVIEEYIGDDNERKYDEGYDDEGYDDGGYDNGGYDDEGYDDGEYGEENY